MPGGLLTSRKQQVCFILFKRFLLCAVVIEFTFIHVAANLGHGGERESAQAKANAGGGVNEQDTVAALGIAQAVQAAH